MDHQELFRLVVRREHRKGVSIADLALTFGIPESAVQEHLSVEPRCCYEQTCPRLDLARLLTPEDPIEQQVERIAAAVAQTCRNLTDEDLRCCFSQFFEIGSECLLFESFCETYHREQTAARVLRP